VNKTIKEAELRGKDVNILAIEKEGIVKPNPSSDTIITLGDRLICFGKLETIRREIYAEGD
jgi:ribosomal protein S6--L-glutamate ligase